MQNVYFFVLKCIGDFTFSQILFVRRFDLSLVCQLFITISLTLIVVVRATSRDSDPNSVLRIYLSNFLCVTTPAIFEKHLSAAS